MKEIVYFFWCQWLRACQMDAANKINGKPTYRWIEADSWVNAYKDTLSKNKQSEFDKEWNKLSDQLARFQNGERGVESPLKL